ncbi:MAG: type II secretion system protein [Frankiales bacterium]|nr:type II secretion system protein [Frankiales bacterium]
MTTSRDSGFSLIELVVGIGLLAVIGAITTQVIITSFHKESYIEGRTQALIQVRQAMQRTMRELRGADPLVSLTGSSLEEKVTTPNNVTRDITYAVTTSGGVTSLVENEVDRNSTTNAVVATQPQRTVVSHLMNSSSQPVFSVISPVPGYQTSSASVNPSTCAVSGTSPQAYEPKCVGTVQLQLVVLPIDAASGSSLCPATLADPTTCYLDVSDSADLRNNS